MRTLNFASYFSPLFLPLLLNSHYMYCRSRIFTCFTISILLRSSVANSHALHHPILSCFFFHHPASFVYCSFSVVTDLIFPTAKQYGLNSSHFLLNSILVMSLGAPSIKTTSCLPFQSLFRRLPWRISCCNFFSLFRLIFVEGIFQVTWISKS